MTMTRFVPFRSSSLNDVAVLQNRLNSIFSEFARTDGGAETLAAGNFTPAADVYEDAQKLVLKLEVPGIKPADLDIRLEGRTLTVRGERSLEAEEKEENFHRVERRFGTFVRSWTLPSTVDAENVDATTADGVLTLTLAKKPEAKPKQIAIKAAPAAENAPKQVEASTTPQA